jgi:hypothetical protein
MPVEVCEAKERLDILDFMGLGPVSDGFNFLGGHGKSGQRKAITEVFHRVRMELTFLRIGIQTVLSESSEYLTDMLPMGSKVHGISEDIVQVDYHRHV